MALCLTAMTPYGYRIPIVVINPAAGKKTETGNRVCNTKHKDFLTQLKRLN